MSLLSFYANEAIDHPLLHYLTRLSTKPDSLIYPYS